MSEGKAFKATLCARCPKCGSEVCRSEGVVDADNPDQVKTYLSANLKQLKEEGALEWVLVPGIKIHLVAIEEAPPEDVAEPAAGVPEFEPEDGDDDLQAIATDDELTEEIPPPQRQRNNVATDND